MEDQGRVPAAPDDPPPCPENQTAAGADRGGKEKNRASEAVSYYHTAEAAARASNRLPILAVEIRRAHANVQDAAKAAAEYAIAAGHALIEAKELVKHGEWLPWLKDHCALAERTAQLYMKLARSGHSATTVAALGLQGAERALVLEYCFFQPLHDGADDTRRTWWLFALFLADHLGLPAESTAEHIDWIGRRDFRSVDEWLIDGPKWVRSWGGKMSDLTGAFAGFCARHPGETIEDIAAALAASVKDEPPAKPKRRKRKSATVADFAEAEARWAEIGSAA